MNKLRIMMLALIGLGAPIALGVGLTHAQSFKTHTSEDQVIDSSLYSAGQSINIRGTINGDVYCAGQHVVVDATVHGDVLCAGQDVTISGHIDGSVRTAGQNVTVDAQIGRSLNVASQQFILEKQARVGQDATIAGSDNTLQGEIGRDALIGSGTSRLENTVGRNVRYSGSKLTLAGTSHIKGGLTYDSKNAADIASNAQIDGALKHNTPAAQKPAHHLFGIRTAFAIFLLASILVFSMLLVLVAPQAVRAVNTMPDKHFGKTLLTGLLACCLMPFVIIALCISIVGLPLGMFVLLSWIAILFLSGPLAAYYLGSKIIRKKSNDSILIMLLGSVVLAVLYFIPGIGVIAMLLAFMLGSGALLLAIKQHLPKPKYRV